MNNVRQATDDFIKAILESEEYLDYRAELEKVKQHPGLKEQIDDFRAKIFQMQTAEDVDFDKLDNFEKEFENFRENPIVMDFQLAEVDFCRMMQRVLNHVIEEIRFE